MLDTLSSPHERESATPILWQGRFIGRLSREGTWRKVITKGTQWSYKHDAPGVQAAVWAAIRPRVQRVEVVDRRSGAGCTLWLAADDFDRLAIRDTLNPRDGAQLFVERSYWHVEHHEGYQQRLPLEGGAAS